MWKIIIFIQVLLSINLDACPWTLKNILFKFICRLSFENFIVLLGHVSLVKWTTKGHLVLHWNRSIILSDRIDLFLFRYILLVILLLKVWMTEVRWDWWHCNRRYSMWTMNHTSCNTLLMSVVSSLFCRFCIFSHMLEV